MVRVSAPNDPVDSIPILEMPEDMTGWEPDYSPPPRPWQDELLRSADGKQLKKESLHNIILFIGNKYRGVFVLNEFSSEVFIARCPPWDDPQKFKVRRLAHDDVIRMTAQLECDGLAPTPRKTEDAILTVAKVNSVHPVRRYFDTLVWDGRSRLETWLSYYLGAEFQPTEYLATVGTKWLVAAVTRIFEPGAKFDHMLVLEGAQGRGKSTALRVLATFGHDEPEEYFCDALTMGDIHEPRVIAMLQGKMIVEFSELDGMGKKDDESLKRWITLQVDELQKKYQNQVTQYPRQFVLSATTNNNTWLRDPSGNRRYWPVRVGNRIDIDALRRDKEHLWAEAVALYKKGHQIWLSNDDPIYQVAEAEQAQRLEGDVWADAVMEFVKDKQDARIAEILEGSLNIEKARQDKSAEMRVRNILKSNGWVSDENGERGGKRCRVWKNKCI